MRIPVQRWDFEWCVCGHGRMDHRQHSGDRQCWACARPDPDNLMKPEWGCIEFVPSIHDDPRQSKSDDGKRKAVREAFERSQREWVEQCSQYPDRPSEPDEQMRGWDRQLQKVISAADDISRAEMRAHLNREAKSLWEKTLQHTPRPSIPGEDNGETETTAIPGTGEDRGHSYRWDTKMTARDKGTTDD